MRWTTSASAALPLAILWLAAAPAAAAPQAPPAVAAAPGLDNDADLIAKVTCRPQSIQFNSYVNFDERGQPRNANTNLSLALLFEWDAAEAVVTRYRNLAVAKVLTSGDELLTPLHVNGGDNTVWRNFGHRGGHERTNFSVNFNLPLPTRQAQKLLEVKGSVELTFAVGPLREAVLGPLSDVDNKRARIKGINDSLVVVRRIKGDNQPRLRVETSQALMNLLVDIQFVSANGIVLDTDAGGGGNDGNTVYREFRLALPDDAKVRLVLFSELKSQAVPFELRDIPLPMTKPDDAGVDLVIVPRPLGNRDDAVNPQAPKIEQLEVILEGGA